MIITVSVILGFKHTIRDKVVGFGSHIQVTNFVTQQTAVPAPIAISDTLMRELKAIPNVRQVECYTMTQGILKTDSDFLGVAFKGVGEDYDLSFIRQNMLEGKLPTFSSQKSSNHIVVSRKQADKLHLHVGDKVYAYFIAYDDVRARRYLLKCLRMLFRKAPRHQHLHDPVGRRLKKKLPPFRDKKALRIAGLFILLKKCNVFK